MVLIFVLYIFKVYIACAIYLGILSAIAIPLNLTFVCIFAITKKVGAFKGYTSKCKNNQN